MQGWVWKFNVGYSDFGKVIEKFSLHEDLNWREDEVGRIDIEEAMEK